MTAGAEQDTISGLLLSYMFYMQERGVGKPSWQLRLFKWSNILNFPASETMSAALFKLKPGGLREPHWHVVDEYVSSALLLLARICYLFWFKNSTAVFALQVGVCLERHVQVCLFCQVPWRIPSTPTLARMPFSMSLPPFLS